MHRLRARLLALSTLVVVLVLAAMGALSRHVVTHDLQRLTLRAAIVDTRPVRAAAAALGRGDTWPADADSLLARLTRGGRSALVAVDDSGRVVAASAPALRALRARVDATGQLTLSSASHRGATRADVRLVLHNPPSAAILHDGRSRGQVIAVPRPPDGDARESAPIQRAVNRGLLFGAAAALGVALLLLWLFAGRIVGPIEAVTAAARRMAGGDLGARVTVRGDDEVATLARAFNAMAESLAHANATRQQLTRDVAHELRTPLTTLRAHIEALQDGVVAPAAAVYASLHDDVLLLTRLIDDLESIARSESGELPLALADVAVADAFRAAEAAFRATAQAAGVALRVEDDGDLRVRADPVRLGQMLRNVIANALAYTPSGGHVTLSAEPDGDCVLLRIADTGAGIDPAHLSHVFERFYRADASRSRATGGSGLGLAIVRQFAHAHGGTADITSQPGRGTIVTLRLPRAR